jgi:hypothetical protein
MFGDQRRGDIAQNLLTVRGLRHESFPSEIFDEHAWNMLLHLFSAQVDNETVTEADLIRRSHTTFSVGSRWLQHLVADGQVEAREDGDDVALTASAVDRMRTFLDAAQAVHSNP